ncbi:hypothetical protein AB2T85_05560 [Clostridium butyricum]
MGMKKPRKKKQPITVRLFYPETEEGMTELRESQSRAVLDILEKQLGPERLKEFMEYVAEQTI